MYTRAELYTETLKRIEVVKNKYAEDRMDLDERFESAMARIYHWNELEDKKIRKGNGSGTNSD